MNIIRKAFTITTIIAILIVLNAMPGIAINNLVTNSSFEQFNTDIPDSWTSSDTQSRVKSKISTDKGRISSRCVKITCTAYPQQGTEQPNDYAGIYQDDISIQGGRRYHISFWMKAQGTENSPVKVALVNPYPHLIKLLDAGEKWKRFDFDFSTSPDIPQEKSRLSFGIEGLGSIWVDDVVITEYPITPARLNPRIPCIRSKNLIPNSSFEAGVDGWSSLSIAQTNWGGDLCGLYGDVVSEGAWDGSRCLKIELGPGRNPITYFDVWPASKITHPTPLAANLGWIDARIGNTNTLSAYMRTDKPGVKGRLMFRFAAIPDKVMSANIDRYKEITLSQEWTRHEFSIPAEGNQMFIAVGPDLSATPDASAVVWIDSIQLEESSTSSSFTPRELVEVGLDTGKYGNVFNVGEKPSLQVMVSNRTKQKSQVTLNSKVIDYFGKTVSNNHLTVSAPPNTSIPKTWPLGISSPGYYQVEVSWKSGSIAHSRSLRVTVIKPYIHTDSAFGINHAPSSDKLCKMMINAGMTWGRDWSINWGHLEPEQGKLSWELSDQQIYRLRDAGMNVISLLPPLPSTDWASTAPADIKPELWNRMCFMPKDITLLTDFMTKAINHYKPTVKVWEFLNEPVWTGFCLPGSQHKIPGANYKPVDYISLLKQAYPMIKAADPDCKVIGGFSAEPWHFSEEFITSGAMDYVDIFNLHYYPGYESPETFIPYMRSLLDLMDKHGKRKPIWMTECSYYAADNKPWTPWIAPSNHWSANRLLDSERICADWTARYNLIMLAHGVEKLFYHEGINGSVNRLIDDLEFALLAPEGEPRKMYVVQSALANLLGPNPKYATTISKPDEINGHSTHGVFGYSFQCGNQAVMAVWLTEPESMKWNWTINLPKGIKAFNVVGDSIPDQRITLSVSPVYLVTDTQKAADLAKACKLSANPKSVL